VGDGLQLVDQLVIKGAHREREQVGLQQDPQLVDLVDLVGSQDRYRRAPVVVDPDQTLVLELAQAGARTGIRLTPRRSCPG
jgi:hypothetical protein